MKSKLSKRITTLAITGALVGVTTVSLVPRAVLASPGQPPPLNQGAHGVLAPSLKGLLATQAGSKNTALAVIVRLRGVALGASRFHTLSLAHAPLFHALASGGASDITPLPLINSVAVSLPAASIQTLLGNPDVAEILPDRQVHIPQLPALAEMRAQFAAAQAAGTTPYNGPVVRAPLSTEPEALSLVHADAVQQEGYAGRGVRVAVIDSGLDITNPDLKGVVATDARGRPLRADFTGTDLTDTVGHGTACASMIAAQGTQVYTATNATLAQVFPTLHQWQTVRAYSRFTVKGMAPQAKIMSAKIFDARVLGGGGQESWIVRAIQWAVQNKADVISESFGALALTSSGSDPISQADQAAVRAGVIVLVAGGNSGPGTTTISSPAVAPGVIAVGASTSYRQFAQTGFLTQYGQYQSDNIAYFTSRGPTADGRPSPDVFAPGAFGWALFPTNKSDDGPTSPPYTYGTFGGTSQATPVTAGVVALLYEAYMRSHGGARPSPAYVKNVLMSTADDLGYPAFDQGAGRINALRAEHAITGQGPSVNIYPNSIVSKGLPGAPLSASFTVTNTGSTTQQMTPSASISVVAHHLTWSGRVLADLTMPHSFWVPAGMGKLTASVNWRRTDQIVFANGSTKKDIVLRIALYDPLGRLVNYGYGVGSGFATTYAAHPIPGKWVAVVSQSGRHDPANNNHFINEPYTAVAVMSTEAPFGRIEPGAVTLAPGARQTFTVLGSQPDSPSTDMATIRVRTGSGQVAIIPMARTAWVPFLEDQGGFHGAFTGPASAGLDSELKFYSFAVQPGASNIAVSLKWPDPGYGILALLVDPHGAVVNFQFNGQQNSSDSSAPLDLRQNSLQVYWANPEAGAWQIVVSDIYFSGTHESEGFRGAITLNQGLVGPSLVARTIKPDTQVNLNIHVRNPGVVPELLFGYATTNDYNWIPIQSAAGQLGNGNPVITNTQVFTFSTGFVPPSTKSIVSYVASISPSVPVDLVLSAFFGSETPGVPGPVSFGGKTYNGSTAVVNGRELPIGSWDGQVTLQKPKDERVTTTIVGQTMAYTLQPHPWITLRTSLNGSVLSGRPLTVDAGGNANLAVTIKVPKETAAGTYTGHIFVYSLNGDKLGDVPVIITVPRASPDPAPTAEPKVNDVVSSAYFPEGQTSAGSTQSMDVLNTTGNPANGLLVLTQEGGQTIQTPFRVPPHTHSSLNVNSIVGGDKFLSAQVRSDGNLAFGRVILRPDKTGSYSTGTPAPSGSWYFADGYTVETFHQYIVLFNPSSSPVHVRLTLAPDAPGGQRQEVRTYDTTVGPIGRQSIDINALMPGRALSVAVKSAQPIVAERVLYFGTNGQGLTSRLGATAPSTDLFFDAGSAPANAQSHLSVYNPGVQPATLQIVYTDASGGMIGFKSDTVLPGRRVVYNITGQLRVGDVAALLHSSQPVVAEKVTYFGDFRASRLGAEDSFGTAQAARQWTFPGGTSGLGFQETIALTNRTGSIARIVGTWFDNKGHMVSHTFTVAAGARAVVDVNKLKGVARGVHGSQFQSLNDVPFFATQHILYADGTAGLDSPGVTLAGSAPGMRN